MVSRVWNPYDVPPDEMPVDAVLCSSGNPTMDRFQTDTVLMKRHKDFIEPIHGVWRW
jgi:hypothetical protein